MDFGAITYFHRLCGFFHLYPMHSDFNHQSSSGHKVSLAQKKYYSISHYRANCDGHYWIYYLVLYMAFYNLRPAI